MLQQSMEVGSHRVSGRLWRVVAVLAIVHVVLMFGSFSLQRVAPLGAAESTVTADHVTWPMGKGFTGGYLTCLSFLVFLLVATLLARLLRGDSEASGWAASVIAGAGSVYVAVTLTGALANLGAALYDGHRGAPLTTVTALDHVHWFAAFLATAVLGLFTLAVAAAVHLTAALPRWVAFTGYVVGAVAVCWVPGAAKGLVDTATLVWVVWFIAPAVAASRRSGHAVVVAGAATVASRG